MAVDTRNERAAILGIALSAGFPFPNADGTVDQADRQHTALSYPGILAIAIVSIWTDQAGNATTWADQAGNASTWSDVATGSTVWGDA